jgi:TonB-linked SusC/RagA family outer membrane protein
MKEKITVSNKLLLPLVLIFGISANSATAEKFLEQEPAQQQISVTGRVIDAETKESLPGVSIAIKETTRGTITGPDGNYSIEAPANAILVFSFVGYQNQSVEISGRTEIDVVMEQAFIELEEVVAIGYGTRDVTGMTGSVSRMGNEQIKMEPVGNVIKSLQGNVAGVTVVRGKDPGSGATVRIHGLGTIGNNNPLFIVDGIQTSAHNLSASDVKSITVLKDAASTAVYGARGANGVILIETLEGKRGQETKISFSSRFGVARQYRRHDMLDVQELGEVRYLSQINSGIADPTDPMYKYGPNGEVDVYNYLLPSRTDVVDESLYDRKFPWEDGDGTFPITRSNREGTDWYDAVTRNARLQDYTLTITGGSEKSTYGVTAGFNEEESAIGTSKFTRFTLRSKSTTDINDWLRIGENIRLTRTSDMGYQGQGTGGIIGQVLRIPTIVPLTDIDGYYAPFTQIAGAHGHNNPVASIAHGQDITNIFSGMAGDAFAEISPVSNLRIKSLFGFSLGNSHNKSPLENTPEEITPRQYDELSESYSKSTFWSWTNTLTYSGTIGDNHSYEILLGSEVIESTSSNLGASRQKFFLTNEDYWVMNAGELNQTNSGSASDWALNSFFTRLHYELFDKYLMDVTVRRDGSSRFGRENRYGTFPAVAVAWRMSEENFMSTTSNWLTELKLRASWGQSGNDQIGNYNGFTTYVTNQIFSYYPIQGQNSGLNAGFQSAAFGNPDTKWETTTSANIGIDATVADRLSMTFDIWQKNTHDMLYPRSIPFVYGIAAVPSVNIGEMKNVGFDIGLNYNGYAFNKELTYRFSAIVSHFQNEILKLSDEGGEFIDGPRIREQYYTRAEPGTSFPEFYGYKVDGIFQTEEEADAHPAAFGSDGTYNKPGHFKFRDVNGDGVIDSDDRTYLGSPHPDFSGSFTGFITYKQLDLSFQFYGSYGNDIMNVERRLMDFNFFQTNRGKRRLYESWGSPYLADNRDAKMPIAELNDADSQRPSSYYVEDGSFLRLQQLELGYSLPATLTKLVRLRVYIMATDLFTITKFTGLDPEVPWDGMNGGINHGTWPTARRVMAGVTLNF